MRMPYHESDHVLNLAYNLLAGGTCLEDLELWRNDEVYLDALGAQRTLDLTTAGDFCRRFTAVDVEIPMNSINNVRVKVWRRQPPSFLEEAIKTTPRQRPVNVKEAIVQERGFENIRLQSEEVAESDYAPGQCRGSYRIVAVPKNLSIERGKRARCPPP